ncbi:biotin carboxylase N-terminal domain-containing protein [Actinomadura luteofluorescens]|uniref:acetyl/propionyl/methylcrotonyl-CoA carboxylase subunit alpha n=1 Tax=Actinomadura luteofluorescens TaxID=46163 RepID=UPI002164E40D|nr:biotin carboxylase N-terminal domain-containing protein [Actinomadura glauciflava]MCR3745023.1 propionyl-CoA carboxylase alpha chain [Actinomadura glauciflava]
MTGHSINRLLVANRGEIARRVFTTCRRLGIATVAVHSDPDARAPFAEEADMAIALGGSAAAESYLRADAIVAAARRAGADAVHPGYGFLAENAALAQAVLDAGLVWVGPSPAVIAAMGSKTEARERMQAAGVPMLPGRTLDGVRDGGLAALGAEVGYPLLVKAAAGGGGKGIRLVPDAAALAGGVEAARREAASAFGDDTVFLERFAGGARHVEIQIVGDRQGRVAALHERDCSVQRRHQKVIEEAPSPALDPGTREAMGAAAVAAGEALGYVGAGTVEFLLTDADEFFFLEVNTRLQVEHPVTESVTGLDLVELQLLVAEGHALPDAVFAPPLRGHAIEARLYAEDAANGFLPVTGTLSRFRIPGDVRVDSGVRDGSVIGPHYDPMLAKVIAHGRTRAEAARKLADALARAQLHGIVTNRDFLVRILRHPEFLAGGADTSFLERHDPAVLAAPLLDARETEAAVAAAALALQARRRRKARVLAGLPSGWRNNRALPQRTGFMLGESELTVEYALGRSGDLETLRVNGADLPHVAVHHCEEPGIVFESDGRRRRYEVSSDGDRVFVNTAEGQVALRESPRFAEPVDADLAGSLRSPMPGRVVRVLVEDMADVEAGRPLLVLEAMKMEHEVAAPQGGVVSLKVREGAQVEAGTVLAVLDADPEP